MRMRPTLNHSTILAATLAACVSASALAAQQAPATNWAPVEDILGRKGAMQPGDVIKFAFPRSDLSVSVGGVTLKPALALGGWVALKEVAKGQTMAMGDLVLTEDEVSPVMRALQAGGVQ